MTERDEEHAKKVALIQRLAREGKVRLASDALAAKLRNEIETIDRVVMKHFDGSDGHDGMIITDLSSIGDMLVRQDGRISPRALEALRTAGKELGIELTPDMMFVDAALALRDRHAGQATS